MKIYQLYLKCFHLDEMKKFYTEDLEMELLSESEHHFTVSAGTTKIFFELDTSIPYYHVCFRTGSKYIEHMYHKLAENKLLLSDEKGHYSMFWEGKQVYFFDPDGNILEILERPFHWGESQPEAGWYDIGEIGMPVPSVKKMQESLRPYIRDQRKDENDTFAFYGDQKGVFVIVKEGRNWKPSARAATIHPITAVVLGEQEGRFTHPELPYDVFVRKEWNDAVPAVQFRMARPTNQMDKIIEFYEEGLGLEKIGGFKGHAGYDGVMFGLPNYSYHLEFTQSEEKVKLPMPTKEHLLVFYLPNLFELNRIVHRLSDMGYKEVEPENPYWGRGGVTIEDPDGYRIVLMNTVGI
ncbi:catechol 2,3-dioxygenase-like lactoylglutathione lyase family enzyme [Neobacillus ginsengisoli]|uniref:Catechol 2,3-dioxygenase-like lactoylglutathione lyase family enzyme n=2 Tax=Neobacillus ginsengisoli TaxID=904295 RepID=A0ABT9XTD7_9BACI|nr:VOC family protein [Neobacillus ginsengisoli]MDQ0198643.1 catechol 2,3-dioxygenase-like lactoylglutathione lyase family enzyme [Neobacillus ginsengisoli]